MAMGRREIREENRARKKKKEEEELNSRRTFRHSCFLFFSRGGHADKAVRFDSDICLSRRKANKRDKFKSEWGGHRPVASKD